MPLVSTLTLLNPNFKQNSEKATSQSSEEESTKRTDGQNWIHSIFRQSWGPIIALSTQWAYPLDSWNWLIQWAKALEQVDGHYFSVFSANFWQVFLDSKIRTCLLSTKKRYYMWNLSKDNTNKPKEFLDGDTSMF